MGDEQEKPSGTTSTTTSSGAPVEGGGAATTAAEAAGTGGAGTTASSAESTSSEGGSPAEATATGIAQATPLGGETAEGRIRRLTKDKWGLQRENEQLKAQLRMAEDTLEAARAARGTEAPAAGAAAGTGTETPAATTKSAGTAAGEPTYTRKDIERLAEQGTAELAFQQEVAAKIINTGTEAYGVDGFTKDLVAVRDITGPVVPRDILEAAMETGVGHKVFHELAQKPEEIDRLLNMTPARRAVVIGSMGAKIVAEDNERARAAAQPEVSGAPKPIKPRVAAGGSGGRAGELPLDHPDLPMAEFMKRREAELRAQAEARGGRRR